MPPGRSGLAQVQGAGLTQELIHQGGLAMIGGRGDAQRGKCRVFITPAGDGAGPTGLWIEHRQQLMRRNDARPIVNLECQDIALAATHKVARATRLRHCE